MFPTHPPSLLLQYCPATPVLARGKRPNRNSPGEIAVHPLVALGLILLLDPEDREEMVAIHRRLSSELRHTVLANLATLALLDFRSGMPDPTGHRQQVAELRRELEQEGTP